MKSMLLAQAERVVPESAPAFQVVGKTHQTVAAPVLNVAGQAVPVGIPASAPAMSGTLAQDAAQANSILGPTMSGYFEILGYLLLVLGGVWLLLWLLRRSGVGVFSPERQIMAIESRLSLGPKKWMVVTRVHGKRLVLGVTDHTITKLAELPSVDQESRLSQVSGKEKSQGKKQGKFQPKGSASGLASTAQKLFKKNSPSPSSAQSGSEKEGSDDFEKFYAAAQEQERKD